MPEVLMCGNDATGEASVRAGCRFYAGYPITPQNELTAYMSWRVPEGGGAFLQCESELAAIATVFGASVAGCRAMTSSSSPGISLKQEGISYMAACELPVVIVNMMRGGPGLGNIAPSQADYFQATKGGGHGDYHTIVLAPHTVQELIELTGRAFELADEYRTPVMILGDGMLGQMMEPVTFAAAAPEPGGTVPGSERERPWVLDGARGREPRLIRSLLLKPGALEELNEKLQAKYRRVEQEEVRWEDWKTADADLLLVAYGTCARIGRAVVDAMRKRGRRVGLIRPITLWPFPYERITEASGSARSFLVVEMSAGQMVEDVRLAVGRSRPVAFYGRTGGAVPEVGELEARVEQELERGE